MLVLWLTLGICFSFLGVMWIGGWETKGFISGQFYSNSVTFANSIHVGKANSESSLCSVFIVKFWCGNILSFFFYQIPWVLLSTWILDCLGMIVNSLCLEYLLACKIGKGGDLKIGFRISLWCELVLTISITIKGVI